jgi:hypothetical protein
VGIFPFIAWDNRGKWFWTGSGPYSSHILPYSSQYIYYTIPQACNRTEAATSNHNYMCCFIFFSGREEGRGQRGVVLWCYFWDTEEQPTERESKGLDKNSMIQEKFYLQGSIRKKVIQ